MIVSETFAVEDLFKYDATEYSQSHTGSSTSYNIYSNANFSFTDWEVSFDQKIANNGGTISLENPSDRTKNLMVSRSSDGRIVVESNSFTSTQLSSSADSNYHSVSFKKQGTTLTIEYDNVAQTFTVDNSFNIERTPKFRMWASNTAYIKNLKIKEL